MTGCQQRWLQAYERKYKVSPSDYVSKYHCYRGYALNILLMKMVNMNFNIHNMKYNMQGMASDCLNVNLKVNLNVKLSVKYESTLLS